MSRNYSYETLVATIPDPRRTRLGLFTDRVLENIQRGAAKSGWEYDSQWLPWQDSPDADERDPEKRLRQRAAVNQEQSEPGILVFRHQPVRENEELRFHRRLLLVFIVGETPTAGIDKAQFVKAREYAGKIVTLPQAGESQPVQPSLRVLGPTFSGSFASLAELVRSSEGRLNIVSGTVTGKRYAAAFLSTVKPLDRVRFASARVYDEDLDFPLKQVLKKLKISPQDVVSLVEDESGYGNSQTYVPRPLKPGEKAPDQSIPTIFFPREISHLRNAYREAVGEAKDRGSSSQSLVPFTLKDNRSGQDSLPTYAELQTAQSQNAALQELLLHLRRSRVRLARIAATNPLDVLFLVQIVHQQFPDLRLLLTSADLLLIQESDIEHITGALVLAPKPPMLAEEFHEKERATIAVDTTSEGVFEATSALLNANLASYLSADQAVSLNSRVWLVQATRSGFAPIAVFPTTEKDREEFLKNGDAMPIPSRFWFLLMNGASFVCIALTLTSLYSFYVRAKRESVPGWLQLFELQTDYLANPGRAFFLAAMYVCLAVMVILLLQPAIASQFSPDAKPYIFIVEGLAFTAFLGISITLLCIFLRFLRGLFAARTTLETQQKYYACYWVLLIAVAITIEICWGYCCHSNTVFSQSYLFRFRALQLYPAASPTIPFLLSLTGVALVFGFQLRRVVWHEETCPCFPADSLDVLPGSKFAGLYSHLYQRLYSIGAQGAGFGRNIALITIECAGFVLMAYLLVPASFVNTAEPASYDAVYVGLVGAFLALLMVTCLRAFLVWRTLRSILVRLHYLPLVHVFTRFQQVGGSRHVWAQTLKLPAMDTVAISTPRIHDLSLLPKEELANYPKLADVKGLWADYDKARCEFLVSNRTFCKQAVRKMRTASDTVAEALTSGILLPNWEANGYMPKPEAGKDDKKPPADASRDRPYELAVEFVVLQYISFIRYVMRQLRNLAWLLSVGFLFVALSLSSYNFQAPQAIGRFLLALFLVEGGLVTLVLAQMERDGVLSRLAGSAEGELNKDFFLHVLRFGALPALGLLASIFPSVASFLFSWVQPGLQSIH